jgi:ABC-2 type transport system ATP-binding protein
MVVPTRSAIDVRAVRRTFGSTLALDGVSLQVPSGHIEGLLGRNGAGKTTLLRILAGLVTPDDGSVRVAGVDAARSPLAVRSEIGLVPSGDRSFYLRISGFENLVFFARLQGIRRREAGARAQRALAQVGLEAAARAPVGTYSHGMQKRLGVARALLTSPAVLLGDEATHDLDPEGAIAVRGLIRAAADAGAAVVWATQRVEEIRGFADGVTVLDRGLVRFGGTVEELLAAAESRRYVLELRNGKPAAEEIEARLQERLAGVGRIHRRAAASRDSYELSLSGTAVLGDALSRLLDTDVTVVSCRQELSEVEEAFMALVAERP